MTGLQALAIYSKKGILTVQEESELPNIETVYFIGERNITNGSSDIIKNNENHDDEKGFYKATKSDHINFRYEVKGVLGKGSFG